MQKLAFPDYGSGTCINCGFLSQISRSQPGQHEFVARQRAEGRMPTSNVLWCFRHAANLNDEFIQTQFDVSQKQPFEPAVQNDDYRATAIRQVIQKGRNCDLFDPWVEHFDPKWHFEDVRMRELEEMRKTNRQELAQIQQKSNETLAGIMETQASIMKNHKATTEALKEIIEDANQDTNRWQWAFLAMTLIALLIAVGALAYPNGASWLTWVPGQESTPSQQSSPVAATSHP